MPNYTIRVEFKGNPSYDQYTKLHTQMELLGFKRWVGVLQTRAMPLLYICLRGCTMASHSWLLPPFEILS